MLSLGKLLWKILFSALQTCSEWDLESWRAALVYRRKLWVDSWSCSSRFVLFFEVKCACLPDRVLVKFCWESVTLLTVKESYLIAPRRRSGQLFFSHTALFPSFCPSRRLVRDIKSCNPCCKPSSALPFPHSYKSICSLDYCFSAVRSLRPGVPWSVCQTGWTAVLVVQSGRGLGCNKLWPLHEQDIRQAHFCQWSG